MTGMTESGAGLLTAMMRAMAAGTAEVHGVNGDGPGATTIVGTMIGDAIDGATVAETRVGGHETTAGETTTGVTDGATTAGAIDGSVTSTVVIALSVVRKIGIAGVKLSQLRDMMPVQT